MPGTNAAAGHADQGEPELETMLKLHADVERLGAWRRRFAGVILALSFGMAYGLAWPSIENAPATRTLLIAWSGAVLGWLLSALAETSREQRLELLARRSRGRFIRVADR